jgi:8-oxo-dGTP pyrophosphatase MutT (NUDIX family)
MYKVFFNNKFVLLTEEFEISLYTDKMLYIQYGDFDELHFVIELLERSDHLQALMISHENLDELWADFRSCFKEVDAAGGLVWNEKGDVLLIHRNGLWDLPKGKLEDDEKPEKGALREVQEECGIQNLQLKEHIVDTFHTYHLGGFRILKRTYWYGMQSDETSFTPQLEEGIDRVKWVPASALDWTDYPTYPSIKLIFEAGVTARP